MSDGATSEDRRSALGHPGWRVPVFLAVGVVLELVMYGFAAGFAYGLSGPCTDEYTPVLQDSSPRDQICQNGLLLGGAFIAALGLVPVAVVTAVWKIRGIVRGAGLMALSAAVAIAMLVIVVRIVESQSPLR